MYGKAKGFSITAISADHPTKLRRLHSTAR